jgi:hypothetical protein
MVLLGLAALQFMAVESPVPLIWPAAGIALALTFRCGWPAAIGTALGAVIIHSSMGTPPGPALALGAVTGVAGNDVGIGDNVDINFDRSLRTDTPLSDADENQLFEYGDTRAPIDATFVLDRSGSMGPHNPSSRVRTYSPIDTEFITGNYWRPIPVNKPFRNVNGDDIILRNTTTGETKQLERRDPADPDNWQEIRVEPCRGRCSSWALLGTFNHPGNDPAGVRVEATKDFIGLMNESNGDRVGIYEFEQNANVLTSWTVTSRWRNKASKATHITARTWPLDWMRPSTTIAKTETRARNALQCC